MLESQFALHNLNFRCITTALVRNFPRQSAMGYRAVVGIEAVRETNRPPVDVRHFRKALAVTVAGCIQRREPTDDDEALMLVLRLLLVLKFDCTFSSFTAPRLHLCSERETRRARLGS